MDKSIAKGIVLGAALAVAIFSLTSALGDSPSQVGRYQMAFAKTDYEWQVVVMDTTNAKLATFSTKTRVFPGDKPVLLPVLGVGAVTRNIQSALGVDSPVASPW